LIQVTILRMKTSSLNFKPAACPRGLKRRFHGDCVITIAWSTFKFHPHWTRCCVLG